MTVRIDLIDLLRPVGTMLPGNALRKLHVPMKAKLE